MRKLAKWARKRGFGLVAFAIVLLTIVVMGSHIKNMPEEVWGFSSVRTLNLIAFSLFSIAFAFSAPVILAGFDGRFGRGILTASCLLSILATFVKLALAPTEHFGYLFCEVTLMFVGALLLELTSMRNSIKVRRQVL